jgi:uncharacterized membrane protein
LNENTVKLIISPAVIAITFYICFLVWLLTVKIENAVSGPKGTPAGKLCPVNKGWIDAYRLFTK